MSAPYRPVTLDDSEQLLAMSYRLRYQTFCLERLFFSRDAYPTQLEFDTFDAASVHVGVLNAEDELVGTARVVMPNASGLPLLRYCTLFPGDTTLSDPANTVVELSRVIIKPRRRMQAASSPSEGFAEFLSVSSSLHVSQCGLESHDALASLIKGMYQVTKRLHGTHWIIAIEKALRRRIKRYGLPFRVAGPEVDYFGPVAPYIMSLADLDAVIRSGRYPVLDDFPVGLEPGYHPSSIQTVA